MAIPLVFLKNFNNKLVLPSKKLIIAVDKKIAYLDFFFQKIAPFVEVVYFADLTSLPRKPYLGIFLSSSTKLKNSNFSSSALKFVASPTTGLDHIADFFLTEKSIIVASAKGANRQAVSDYVLAVIFIYALEKKLPINQIILGIIGFGAIGSCLSRRASELGISTIIYDPFVSSYKNSSNLLMMKKAQIITFHVPLTKKSKYATYQMINENYFKKILPAQKNTTTLLINTSRGAIFNQEDFKKKINEKKIAYAFDVWSTEPYPNKFLLKNAWLATPHIAGYSLKSKWGSSRKVFFDFIDYFKIPYPSKKNEKKKSGIFSKKTIKASAISSKKLIEFPVRIKAILEEILLLNQTTLLLKKSIPLSKEEKKKLFFSLRKKYLKRREFSEIMVKTKEKNIFFPTLLKQFSEKF